MADRSATPASPGLATLLISADLDELIGLSDTILVMFHGRIVATSTRPKSRRATSASYMTGAAVGEVPRDAESRLRSFGCCSTRGAG